MSEIYLYALGSVVVVSIMSLVGIITLSWKERFLHKMLSVLVALAVGALLGNALIHLVPESLAKTGNPPLAATFVVVGIVIFFLLEKFIHWHHGHGFEGGRTECPTCDPPKKKAATVHPTGYMILFADGLHNFIDGIIIAVSYLVSIEVGIATTIAVILHEIPQEIGDFGVLINAGFEKMRALFYNFLSALLAVFGAITALVVGEAAEALAVWILPFAAGSFIYIATADLIPELRGKQKDEFVMQIAAIAVGVAAMYFLVFFE